MKIKILTIALIIMMAVPIWASMVRIVYRADGGVSIIHPAPKSKRKTETEAQWLNRIFTKTMAVSDDLKGRPYDDVNKTTLPTDRKYRNAWTGSKGNGISLDPIKKAAIDAKIVYTEKQERKIQGEIRKLAIKSLEDKGEL